MLGTALRVFEETSAGTPNRKPFETLFLEVLLEVLLQLRWVGAGSMTLDGISVLVHNELGEVPLDQVQQNSALLLLQELPHGMGLLAVHVHLLEQVELHLAVAHKALNGFGIARLLVGELVTGERQNAKSWRG